MKVLTVGEHAAMTKALVAAAAQRGGVILGTHDMMEAQPITKEQVLGAAQSATIANAEPEAPKSRQVQRAEARRAEKRMRQHMNEHVGGKNRKR